MKEAKGFTQRLNEARKKKEYLKLIFQYPNSNRAIIKRGLVQSCSKDSFNFKEKFDGDVTYSYTYLVEIKPEIELKGGSEAK